MKLAPLQQWMQAVVVHPGDTKAALRSKEASQHVPASRLESVLLPSKTLSASDRIGIYQQMYPLRMRDALSSDYPALEHFLGDRFPDLVTAYTQAHPSQRYTLNRLGDEVPAWLGRQRRLKPRAFLKDLARLEFAVTAAFDAPQADPIRIEDLEGLEPERLGRSVLVTSPSLRLVALEWNANAYLDSWRDENHRHPRPRRARAFSVVVRRDYSVFRFEVTEAAFALLGDLQAGLTINDVAGRALARRGSRAASPEDFSQWFQRWTGEGLFCAVRASRRRVR
jgi:hypothetical protein